MTDEWKDTPLHRLKSRQFRDALLEIAATADYAGKPELAILLRQAEKRVGWKRPWR